MLAMNNKSSDSELPVVHIYWTGGWDSTYRVILLSEKNVEIQPIYISDNRESEVNELNAIESINSELRKKKSNRSRLNDIEIVDRFDIENDEKITLAYEGLNKLQKFGSQYEWLARYADNKNGVELTIHRDDKAFEVIERFGAIKKVSDQNKGDYYVLDDLNSDSRLISIFGKLHFPLLDQTKVSMKGIAEKKGYIDLMNQTWFCHKPIDNEPCGRCNPCIYTMEEGMEYRFNSKAKKRYRREKVLRATGLSFLKRLYKKVFRRVRKAKLQK